MRRAASRVGRCVGASLIVAILLLPFPPAALAGAGSMSYEVGRFMRWAYVSFFFAGREVVSLTLEPSFAGKFLERVLVEGGVDRGELSAALGGPVSNVTMVLVYSYVGSDGSSRRGSALLGERVSYLDLVSLIARPRDLVNYTFTELKLVVVAETDAGVVSLGGNLLAAMRDAGIPPSVCFRVGKYLTAFEPELRDPGWLEVKLRRGGVEVGYIRVIGDPFFNSSTRLLVAFETRYAEVARISSVDVAVTLVNLQTGEAVEESFTLRSGERFVLPDSADVPRGNYTVTEFRVVLRVATLSWEFDVLSRTGPIFFTRARPPAVTLAPLKVVSGRELGGGWYAWDVLLPGVYRLPHAAVHFEPAPGKQPALEVAVVGGKQVAEGFLATVAALFGRAGAVEGTLTVRVWSPEGDGASSSAEVSGYVTEAGSLSREPIEKYDFFAYSAVEAALMRARMVEKQVEYGVITDPVEVLRARWEALMYREYAQVVRNYYEAWLFVELELRSGEAVELLLGYDLAPLSPGRPVKVEVFVESEPQLGGAPLWLNLSTTASTWVVEPSGLLRVAVGAPMRVNGFPPDAITLRAVKVRFYGVEEASVSLDSVSLLTYSQPPAPVASAAQVLTIALVALAIMAGLLTGRGILRSYAH